MQIKGHILDVAGSPTLSITKSDALCIMYGAPHTASQTKTRLSPPDHKQRRPWEVGQLYLHTLHRRFLSPGFEYIPSTRHPPSPRRCCDRTILSFSMETERCLFSLDVQARVIMHRNGRHHDATRPGGSWWRSLAVASNEGLRINRPRVFTTMLGRRSGVLSRIVCKL